MEHIEEVSNGNLDAWLQMGSELWPDADDLKQEFTNILKSQKDHAYIYWKDGEYIGFINISLRNDYVEGSNGSPVGYVEGIYVKPQYR